MLYLSTEILKWSKSKMCSAALIKSEKDDMRDSIIDTASAIFSRFGFKKTTVDDIAQALRKGKSSIYYYFKSKEEIFQAVVDREADVLRTQMEQIMASDMDPREKLSAHIKGRMDLVKNMSNYMELLKNDDLSNLDFAEKFRKKYDLEEIQVISQLLQEGIDKGTFKVKDIELSALAIVTAMKGLEVPLALSGKYANNLMAVIDDMLDILFYGLVKR